MHRLAERTAIVTGGLRGIGRGIVDRLVEDGAHVLVGDLDADGGDVERAHPGRVRYHTLNVASSQDWQDAWSAAEQAFGPVDILINNAGTSRPGSIADTSDEDWQLVMNVNAFGTFLGCRQAVRTMAARSGVIVNIASARGKRPGAATCAYSASKAAVLNMTESIALHCGENRLPIRCNAICPGVIETPLMRSHLDQLTDDDALAVITGRQVIGRLGTAREVADAVIFLACDESSFITGAALDVDGGFAIRDN